MLSVLITGPIGSGKSSALATFGERGWLTLAADDVVALLQQPSGAAFPYILERFPTATLTDSDGSTVIDKAKLREQIFSDKLAKESLEAILHPLVQNEITNWLTTHSDHNRAVEIPLIDSESPYLELFDHIIAITAHDASIDRKASQTGLTTEQVATIRSNQPSNDAYIALADTHIANDSTEEEFVLRVAELAGQLIMR